MPVWVISLITGIIEPIVQKYLDQLILSVKVGNIQQSQDNLNKAVIAEALAKTIQERKDAANDIAHSDS